MLRETASCVLILQGLSKSQLRQTLSWVDNFAFKQYLGPCLNPRWRVLDVCSYSLWGQSRKLAKPDTFPGAVVSEATEPARGRMEEVSYQLCDLYYSFWG